MVLSWLVTSGVAFAAAGSGCRQSPLKDVRWFKAVGSPHFRLGRAFASSPHSLKFHQHFHHRVMTRSNLADYQRVS